MILCAWFRKEPVAGAVGNSDLNPLVPGVH